MNDMPSKLLSQINVREDGCWMFTGAWSKDQYGVMRYNGKTKGAHVVSYEIHIGPVPKGMRVLHSCDNPWCVNPNHLIVGTQQDNIRDMFNKGRDAPHFGEFHGGAKLTDAAVIEIRQLAASGDYTHQEIADMFNVDRSAIGKVVRRERWRHVNG